MGKRDDTEAPSFAAGFTLARQLRKPEFRAILKGIGYANGDHIVMTQDTEPIIDVVARMLLHETGGKAFIAFAHPDEACGFRFLYVETVPSEAHPTVERIDLTPLANIGMLYDALRPCAEYVPSQWMRPLLFGRRALPMQTS